MRKSWRTLKHKEFKQILRQAKLAYEELPKQFDATTAQSLRISNFLDTMKAQLERQPMSPMESIEAQGRELVTINASIHDQHTHMEKFKKLID